MAAASIDIYVAAFVARCDAVRPPGSQTVSEPGVDGFLSLSGDASTRLLVTDDRAGEVLATLLPDAQAGTISVFAAAPRCTELVMDHAGWKPKVVTALSNRDLRTVPKVALPSGLTLRHVTRRVQGSTDGVPLKEAVAAARLADPSSVEDPAALVDYLSSLPAAVRLFAAVDDDDVVRATSGCGTFGSQAIVIFVNTHPRWRRLGVGRAMTAAALRSARDAGASQACLDASDAALPTYLRLGFEVAARATQFSRSDEQA